MNQQSKTNAQQQRFKLRTELRSSLRESSQRNYFVVEDPVLAKFYRIGTREWELAQRFDGAKTLQEIVDDYEAENRSDRLNRKEIQALVNWLAKIRIITSDCDGENAEPVSQQRQAKWTNLLFMRVPLFNPEKLLRRVAPVLAWTVSAGAFVIWLLVCLSGVVLIFDRTDEFWSSMGSVLATNNWILLFLTWIFLKALHELYHGIVCKKYGGRVPQCGLVFIMFSPIAYIDVTSCWRFRSKWERIFTSAAGMYVEFFVAGLAAWGWAYSDPGLFRQMCQNVVVTASVATVLFNGNFLMKFDGYYILSDLLGIQNLYEKGQRYLQYLGRKYWLGVPTSLPDPSERFAAFIRIYAFATLVWRWIFMTGIIILAGVMFHGLGIILASMAVVGWFLVPAIKFAKYLTWGNEIEDPNRQKFATMSLASLAIIGIIANLPWPFGVSAPAVVEFSPLHRIRAERPGFVEKVDVQSGESVKAGTRIMLLRNDQLELEFKHLEIEIELSQKRESILHDDQSASQEQRKETELLLRQRDELAKRVQALTIVAPIDGKIIGANVQDLVGQYFARGDILVAFGDESNKELLLSIAEDDVRFFAGHVGAQVRVKGYGSLETTLQISQVKPKATKHLSHPALGSIAGGPLAVTSQIDDASNEQIQLLTPRFNGAVSLPSEVATHLFPGQVAKVRVSTFRESVGTYLLNQIQHWIRSKIEFAQRR